MAEETYNEKINRNTNWGGDASTGFIPVSGERVQEFIKDELNSKIGAVYKPEGGNVVYYFANEDDKEAFIETEDESYVLSSYETESKYEVTINQETLVLSHSVIAGTTGNTIEFDFKIVDENGMASDSRAKIELSFTGSGISSKFTNEIPVTAGDWTHFSSNVDGYLRNGSNNIAIKITGMSTKATTQFVMTYNIFDLSFDVSFDYNIVKTGNTISVPYIIECSDTKYLEFYLDGVKVDSSESMVITDIRKDSTATLDISSLSPGQHSLQVRAYVRASDGTLFYTPVHFYTFAKYGENVGTSFLMHRVSDDGTKVVGGGDNLSINVSQFEQIDFEWSIFDYLGRRLVVTFEYDGSVISSAEIYENGTINGFSYRPMNFGEGKSIKVYALDDEDEKIFEYTIDVNVEETSSGIKEATDGLLLKLQSIGRRNSDADKDTWSCIGSDGNRYYATFSGFTWNAQQGWDEATESLVISNGATVSFNIQPMLNDWKDFGGAVEIDLETFDIEDENAVICECANNLQENEAYFRVTATNAEFSTSNGAKINTRYKDNERLKIAFIGNRAGSHEDGNLIYIVVNGVLERAALYQSNSAGDVILQSSAFLKIGNPDGLCKVRLRSIRVYNRAITVDQAFNNYVVDSDNVQELYEKNNVLAAGSATEIGFDEVANKLPVMIFTGDMNDIVKNGQDKEWRNFDVEYINRQEPERNFVSFNCQMKLQGTSSLGYPRKNFKLKTKDKNFNADLYAASNYELDPTSVTGNLMLRNKKTGEQIDFDDFKTNGTLRNTNCFTLDYEGNALKKGKYRFRKDAHKANKWTLKADFMESSCSHNVGAGRSWNDIFENTELLNNGEASYTNQTYKDSALVSGSSREYVEYNGVNIEGAAMHYKIPYNTQAIKDQKKYVCRTDAQKICIAEGQDDIRTAIDGFPMVCFYRTSHKANDLVFIGQYNFINDKGSYEVFGFEDIEDPEDEETMIYDASKVEVWEGLKNTNPLSLFKTIDGFYDWNADGTLRKWAETYEARYPDPEDYESDPTSLYELSKWLVSTRHESDTVYSGTLDIDSSFARKINTFQYGYTDDTADSYAYASGTGLEDNAENRQKKFETEKWEHFDVWKLAGYYIYLRRYGAVDQFVKNTMLFTDGNGKYDSRTDRKYRKWFFINYDNDCLFGLRNNGQLAFHWDLDRQTIDSASDIIDDDQADDEGADANAYAMMGHDSTLWNNLEADDEFMRMVRDLDYSMSKYKLNYDNMVEEFDTKQTEMWCERIYNANERYKYIQAAKGIGDMSGNPVNNLWMLQGTRRSHRHWWIANHFNLLDALWLSGDYKNTYVEIKTSCRQGTPIRAVAGAKYYYAWGQQKKIYESNMQRNEGDEIIFSFPTDQSQGDPVYIYSFNKMTEMDFSEAARYVYEGSFKFVLGNTNVQNTMKKLVIGNPDVRNTTQQDTTTWAVIPNLEYIDITNFEGITYVPLSSFRNLHTFKAFGTKLSSFEPAEGAVLDLVELPATIGTMSLVDVSFANNVFEDLFYTPNTGLNTLKIANNAGVGLDYYNKIILPWINSIEASTMANSLYAIKSINISNIKWSFNNLNAVRVFKNFSKKGKSFQLSGVIDLRSCGNLSMDNIEELKEIFGENCFNPKMSSLYIMTPESVFISSEKKEMVAGQENIFERVIYPDERAIEDSLSEIKFYLVEETLRQKSDAAPGEIIFEDPIAGKNYIVIPDAESLRLGLSLTNSVDSNGKEIGILRCEELVLYMDTDIKVLVYMGLISSAFDKISVMDFKIKDPTYASTATIAGSKSLYATREYRYTLSPLTANGELPIGSYSVAWSVDGEAYSQYVESTRVVDGNQLEFAIRMNSSQPEVSSQMTIHATITNHDGTSVSVSYDVLALNETVIMTRDSNPVVMAICYEQGWATDEFAMKKVQAESVTSLGYAFSGVSSSFEFPEFVYFTGVTSINASAFTNSNITEIVLHDGIQSVEPYAFDGCRNLKNVYVAYDDGVGDPVYTRTLPDGITAIEEGVFRGCSSLCELTLPNSVLVINDYAFGGTGFEHAVLHNSEMTGNCLRLPAALKSLYGNAFESEKWTPETTINRLKTLEVPATMTFINFETLRGKYYERFFVEEGSPKYSVIDGVLMSSNGDTLMRYAPRGEAREEYELPSAQIIMPYAFFGTKGLEKIKSPENATIQTIQAGFCMDSDVVEVDLASCANISEIPENAFRNCTGLTTVSLPTAGTLKKFGIRAFFDCRNLEPFVLPNGLEEFACNSSGYSNTFVRCNKFTDVVIPETVTKMSSNSFYECSGIRSFKFPSKFRFTEYYSPSSTYNLDLDTIGYVPYEIVNQCNNLEYLTLPAFSYYEDDGEGGQRNVQINDIGLMSGSKYVALPTHFAPPASQWFTRAGGAFNNGFIIIGNAIGQIKSISVPEIDNGQHIVIVDGVIYSSDMKKLYKAPPAITSVTIPDGVVSIESDSFKSALNLTSVILPSTVKTIGNDAFNQCSQLSNVVFPKGIMEIGERAFAGTIIPSVTLDTDTININQYAFEANNSLTTMIIKENSVDKTIDDEVMVPTLGAMVFRNSAKFKTLILSSDVNIFETSSALYGPLRGAGSMASDKEVLIPVGMMDRYMAYTRPIPGNPAMPFWREVSAYGFTIKEEIPLTGYCDVTVYKTDGTPCTEMVYAKSLLGHLVGLNDTVYTSTCEDGTYLFDLNGLYDGEVITLYSDEECTNEIGSFKPRILEAEYQVGSPVMGSVAAPKQKGLFSTGLFSAAIKQDEEKDEMAEITKSEYEALLSRVNQMMKIIKNLTK